MEMPDIGDKYIQGLECIGAGVFSKCFKLDECQVLVVSKCKAKEIMCDLPDKHRLLPSMDLVDRRREYSIYRMPYYSHARITKRTIGDHDFNIYNQLRRTDRAIRKVSRDPGYKLTRDMFSNAMIDPEVKEVIIHCLDHMAEYDDSILFEISKPNVGVFNGRLILLDCFCFTSRLWDAFRSQ